MKTKLVAAHPKAVAVVLATGEEVFASLLEAAHHHNLRGAFISAIGGFSEATVAFYNVETKQYDPIEVHGQAELLSMLGNVSVLPDGELKLHLHVTLGKRDGSMLGGHLLKALVRPTLEALLTETSEPLRRRHDQATGIPLLEP